MKVAKSCTGSVAPKDDPQATPARPDCSTASPASPASSSAFSAARNASTATRPIERVVLR
jgi:hypothetical protein